MFYRVCLLFFVSATLSATTPLSSAQQQGVFDIRFMIEYNDPSYETPENRAALESVLAQTRNRWLAVVTGYQPNVMVTGADINVVVVDLPDRTGGISFIGGEIDSEQGFVFSTDSQNSTTGEFFIGLDFLNNAIQNSELWLVIQTATHETGHVLAFNDKIDIANGVYAPNGSGGFVTAEYVGTAGLQAYRSEFDSDANFIPVGGLAGVNHWNFSIDNPVDRFNRPLRDDIACATTERSFFSQTTVWALRDFGYETRLPGDFNDDNEVDANDVNFYSGKIGQPATVDPKLDLDQDGMITLQDHDYLIENFIPTPMGTGTLVGDISLDGQANVQGDAFPLVANLNSSGGYAEGDLNADGVINVLGDAFILVSALDIPDNPNLPGDFNGDLIVDGHDADFYAVAIGLPAAANPPLDLDGDGLITSDDHDYLIENLIQTTTGTGTLFGDINLDGQVNVLDDAFVLVGNLGSSGRYADGDLNADGQVDVLGDAFILVGSLDIPINPNLPGDFNDDQVVNAADVDFYQVAIGLPAAISPALDLDYDGMITLADHNYLIENLIQTTAGTGTIIGDINLDGQVDVLGDGFIFVGFLGLRGGYADGDLNADGIVDVLGDAFLLAGALPNPEDLELP